MMINFYLLKKSKNILEIKEINKIFNIFKKEIRIDNKKISTTIL